jgi:hypothetical protein
LWVFVIRASGFTAHAQPFIALDARRHPMHVLQRRDIWTLETADLHLTGIEAVTDAGAGWGPRLDELDFSGEDALPDLMEFVETQVDTFAPAFRRQAPSALLPDLVSAGSGAMRSTF